MLRLGPVRTALGEGTIGSGVAIGVAACASLRPRSHCGTAATSSAPLQRCSHAAHLHTATRCQPHRPPTALTHACGTTRASPFRHRGVLSPQAATILACNVGVPQCRSLFGFGQPERVTLNEKFLVPFPPSVYFDVVLDVDRYHEFVPFCSASRVTRRISPRELEADLTIGFRIFTERYTSRVTFQRPHAIRIQSVQSSVFGHLISTWKFTPRANDDHTSCCVEFDIDFEVSSPIHASAVKLFFTDVAERQVKAFSARCAKLYRDGKLKSDAPAPLGPTAVAAPSPMPTAVCPVRAALPPAAITPPHTCALSVPPPAAMDVDALCSVPQLGARIKFSPDEIEKLRVVFERHALTEADHAARRERKQNAAAANGAELDASLFGPQIAFLQTALPSTPKPAAVPSNGASLEHIHDTTGAELRLGLGGFVALCTDICMSTGGVFAKFRERSTVRTIADVGATGVLSHALFVADPSFYAFYHVQVEDQGVDVAALTHHPIHSSSGLVHIPHQDPDELIGQDVSNTASTPTKLHIAADLPHTFAFGDFLAHFYYLTKATVEERILYNLMVAAKRREMYHTVTFELDQGFEAGSLQQAASPIPDVFSRRSNAPPSSLPVGTLRSATAAYFCMHLGILRHIMPLMAYHRAREMNQQLNSSTDPATAVTLDSPLPTDPGVTVLALLGLLESVLTEAESAVCEAVQEMCLERAAADQSSPLATTSSPPTLPSPTTPVCLDRWVAKWTKQAELLALISVPGLATMIQIHSPTQHH